MKKVLAITAFMMMFAIPALASPFCIGGAAIPVQCIYDDVRLCSKASNPPNTACVINPVSTLSYIGGSNYCLVQSNLTAQCIFVDRNQCNAEASRSRGICIDRRTMNNDANPFKYDNRVQN